MVAIVDPGEGSTPVAEVAGQWVYDAYGEVLNADHILPFPHMRLGNDGPQIQRYGRRGVRTQHEFCR